VHIETIPGLVRVQPAAYEDPTLFTAEHLFPWHLTEDPLLAPFADAADLLAEREWPSLYDPEVLATVDVPCAAAVYYDDPYVLREHSLATAELVPTLRPWITNAHLHNGVQVAPTRSWTVSSAWSAGGSDPRKVRRRWCQVAGTRIDAVRWSAATPP
jgi:hypothetical protein